MKEKQPFVNKIIIAVIVLFLVLVLLVPYKSHLDDGGSVEYRAVLYTITDVHRVKSVETDGYEYEDGTIVEVFGVEVFNNVE